MTQIFPSECPRCGNKPTPWNLVSQEDQFIFNADGKTKRSGIRMLTAKCSECSYIVKSFKHGE